MAFEKNFFVHNGCFVARTIGGKKFINCRMLDDQDGVDDPVWIFLAAAERLLWCTGMDRLCLSVMVGLPWCVAGSPGVRFKIALIYQGIFEPDALSY